MLSAVKTETTFPLVRNFFLCRPSSPTSEKNCLLPVIISTLPPQSFVGCFVLRFKLTLLSPEQTDEQDASAVDCEQRTNGVELRSEDLEYHKRERELADCCANVGAFECSLCCADLHELVTRQYHRACTMQMQMVSVSCMSSLKNGELAM
jgi:hypothetical protein